MDRSHRGFIGLLLLPTLAIKGQLNERSGLDSRHLVADLCGFSATGRNDVKISVHEGSRMPALSQFATPVCRCAAGCRVNPTACMAQVATGQLILRAMQHPLEQHVNGNQYPKPPPVGKRYCGSCYWRSWRASSGEASPFLPSLFHT